MQPVPPWRKKIRSSQETCATVGDGLGEADTDAGHIRCIRTLDENILENYFEHIGNI